jgi:hypothetical protein
MDSYMASNGSCFMVTLIILKNHVLEVGLTQNRETMTLQTLLNYCLILLCHAWGPAWIDIRWNSIWLRAHSHMTSHYTWGSVTTLRDFGSVLGRPLDTFSWALTISWLRLLARVWSGPESLSYLLRVLIPLVNTESRPTTKERGSTFGEEWRADEAPVVDLGLPKNNGAWADLVQLFGTLSLGMHQFPHPPWPPSLCGWMDEWLDECTFP